MKRQHHARRHAPADEFSYTGSRPKNDYKTLQLCRQVQRALTLALGMSDDDIVSALLVEAVDPAPNASRLRVTVSFAGLGGDSIEASSLRLANLLRRLDGLKGFLRAEIASSITRKRAPELIFQIVGRGEVRP